MDTTFKVPPRDQLHASAIKFLIDGGAEKAAGVLLSCSTIDVDYWPGALRMIITVRAPHPSYLLLKKGFDDTDLPPFALEGSRFSEEGWKSSGFSEEGEIFLQIKEAFKAVLPDNIIVEIDILAELIEINPQWQQKFVETLYETNTYNQGLSFAEGKPLYTWNNLRFRSQTEIRIAEAFERAQVLFLPN
jgi:hypothetical protein